MKDINQLTIEEAHSILEQAEKIRGAFGASNPKTPSGGAEDLLTPFLGKKVFIRTVTMHYTGQLDAVTDKELKLSNAAWVADTGRFAQALEEGKLKDVEVFPRDGSVIVGRGALIDCSLWKHDLPSRAQ